MASFERLSEQLALAATIDPQARTATGTVYTDVITMENHHEVMFILMANTIGATDEVDFDVQEDTATTFTGTAVNTITGITQMVAADSDEQRIITIRGEDMTPGCVFLRGRLQHGGTAATCEVAALVLCDRGRYKPDVDYDLASVTEVINA